MKKITPISYLFFVTILYSCGAVVMDVDKELSGGYVYRSEGNSRFIRPDNIFKDGIYQNVVEFNYNKDFIIVLQIPSFEDHKRQIANILVNRYFSFSVIDSLDFSNAKFDFLKSQYKADSSLYRRLALMLSGENSIEYYEYSLILADSIIKFSPHYQSIFSRKINYWIISHKERNENDYMSMSKIYGPYTMFEYLQKRKDLRVPKELKLDSE